MLGRLLELWDSLFGTERLTRSEAHLVRVVASYLPLETASLLHRQVAAVNRVQRNNEGREVALYRLRRGKLRFHRKLRFPRTRETTLLASARLVHPHTLEMMNAELFLAGGRLFSLKFDKSPPEFFAGLRWQWLRPGIVDVRIWFDPLRPTSCRPVESIQLTGWMRDRQAEGRVTLVYAPLSTHQRDTLLRSIDSVFPADYVALMAQTDGVWLSQAWIFGLEGLRKVSFEGVTYLALGELHGRLHGALAVKQSNREGRLFFLDYDRDVVTPAGTSLEKALTDLLGT